MHFCSVVNVSFAYIMFYHWRLSFLPSLITDHLLMDEKYVLGIHKISLTQLESVYGSIIQRGRRMCHSHKADDVTTGATRM